MTESVYGTKVYIPNGNGFSAAVLDSFVASATPYVVDWSTRSVDNQQFTPQGMYVNNVSGTSPLAISLSPAGLNYNVPAGEQTSFPIPPEYGFSASITGSGSASIWWTAQPVNTFVQEPVNYPAYNKYITVGPATPSGSISIATNYGTNTYLIGAEVRASDDSTIGTAGDVNFTLSSTGGINLLRSMGYLPSSASANAIGVTELGKVFLPEKHFIKCGQNPTITLATSVNLTAGRLWANLYFVDM